MRYFRLGLVGYPLGHSLSPRLHQAALEALGLQGEYRLFPVPPSSEAEHTLKAILEELRNAALDGLNVTIPHKQAVIPYLDELNPVATAIGAANTLFVRDGRLTGENTDVPGFLADLRRYDINYQEGGSALVLGAGGSARAVIYALLQWGWNVAIAARRLEQVQELVSWLSVQARQAESSLNLDQVVPIYLDKPEMAELFCSPGWYAPVPKLVVNCTPLGMHPQIHSNPWPGNLPFPAGAFVYDLVYNPTETALVRAAREAGLSASTGLGMLVEQAALSFERWTGLPAPLEAMYAEANASNADW